MQVDLGGIGKGFAADEAAALLKRSAITNALVALGGDIVAAGAPPGTRGWTIDVDIAGPRRIGAAADRAARRGGVDVGRRGTVGRDRRRALLAHRRSADGAALTGRRSVTVIAPAGTLSDGLATAVSVLGPPDGIALMTRTRGAAASISFADGNAVRTVTSSRWRYFAAAAAVRFDAAEFHFRALGLERDPAAVRGAVEAVVHQVAVDPHLDGAVARFDHHRVPLAGRLLGSVGEVQDAPRVAFAAAPLLPFLARAALLHVGHLDVLLDAPEVAGVPVHHLHFDRLREHLVERARRGGVHEHAAIAGLAGKAVLDLETVVSIGAVGQQVPGGVPRLTSMPLRTMKLAGADGLVSFSGRPPSSPRGRGR